MAPFPNGTTREPFFVPIFFQFTKATVSSLIINPEVLVMGPIGFTVLVFEAKPLLISMEFKVLQ